MTDPMDSGAGGSGGSGGMDSNDKLLAALSYPIPIIGIVILLSDTMKAKPFLKFHAVQSILFNVVIYVIYFVASFVTFGFGAICFPLFFLATLWPAYKAYQGEMVEIPVLTNFIKNQGWV